VEKDLRRVLAALSEVGRVNPLHDTEDPDLNPEALDRWREARREAQKPVPEPVVEETPVDAGGGGE
jgi:hypothetical protein